MNIRVELGEYVAAGGEDVLSLRRSRLNKYEIGGGAAAFESDEPATSEGLSVGEGGEELTVSGYLRG